MREECAKRQVVVVVRLVIFVALGVSIHVDTSVLILALPGGIFGDVRGVMVVDTRNFSTVTRCSYWLQECSTW